MILDCLTDDVVWDMPGNFHHEGKEAFQKEIVSEAFTGLAIISISRMIEENDVVMAEGSVRCQFKTGNWLHAVFSDVFEMRGGKIKRLITYLTVLPE